MKDSDYFETILPSYPYDINMWLDRKANSIVEQQRRELVRKDKMLYPGKLDAYHAQVKESQRTIVMMKLARSYEDLYNAIRLLIGEADAAMFTEDLIASLLNLIPHLREKDPAEFSTEQWLEFIDADDQPLPGGFDDLYPDPPV